MFDAVEPIPVFDALEQSPVFDAPNDHPVLDAVENSPVLDIIKFFIFLLRTIDKLVSPVFDALAQRPEPSEAFESRPVTIANDPSPSTVFDA